MRCGTSLRKYLSGSVLPSLAIVPLVPWEYGHSQSTMTVGYLTGFTWKIQGRMGASVRTAFRNFFMLRVTAKCMGLSVYVFQKTLTTTILE